MDSIRIHQRISSISSVVVAAQNTEFVRKTLCFAQRESVLNRLLSLFGGRKWKVVLVGIQDDRTHPNRYTHNEPTKLSRRTRLPCLFLIDHLIFGRYVVTEIIPSDGCVKERNLRA